MDGTWTITELAERAAAVLAADGSAQVSARVRDLPNERLIRWYTTIGLVDPPLGRRGRTALYGPRHLLQLVAVKRRQAAGRSIAEIQLELAAATDATLERIASLPSRPVHPPAPEPAHADTRPFSRAVEFADTSASPAGGEDGASAEGESRRDTFWNTRPDMSYNQAAVTSGYGTAHPPVVQGVRLVPGLTLLLDVPGLSGDDLAAIENAARPLLDELRRRGLLATADSPAILPADPSRRSQ